MVSPTPAAGQTDGEALYFGGPPRLDAKSHPPSAGQVTSQMVEPGAEVQRDPEPQGLVPQGSPQVPLAVHLDFFCQKTFVHAPKIDDQP